MPAQAQPLMQVVRKEEKEARLRDFLQAALETVAGSDDLSSGREILMVARSLDSPVARAVASLAGEIAASGCTLRAVVVLKEMQAGSHFELGALDARFRHVRNSRLVDAHEQLALTSQFVWVGDCMRRDPIKRDAFEFYTSNGGTSAEWALRSFEHIWRHGEPMEIRHAVAHESPPLEDVLAAPTVVVELAPAPALTRH